MNNKIFSIILLLLMAMPLQYAMAQEKKPEAKERDLFYTYIGPMVSVGHAFIWHEEWDGTQRVDSLYNGLFISGGVLFTVFVKNLAGSLSIQYIYNFNSNHYLQHLYYKMSGRYMFDITPIFQIGVGAGAYFESPPSDYDYQGGAGALLPVQFAVKTTSETRLLIDVFAQFGWYGEGENSVKLGYGVDIAFVFKVGTI